LYNKHIAIATAAHLPQGTKDTPNLLTVLHQNDVSAELVIWNDPQVDWKKYDTVFLHCVWDYTTHIAAFRQWISGNVENVSFVNPVELILWNTDKRYLLELQQKGIPLPETSVTTGKELLQTDFYKPIVIKKVVSAGGRGNWLCRTSAEVAAVIAYEQLANEPILAQRYQPAILTNGEYSVVYFAGKLQHVILKLPREGEFRVQSQFGGSEQLVEATKAMHTFGQQVLDALPQPATYARIDFLADEQGQLQLMEVELIEPDLFLRYSPTSYQQLAELL
jgi:glutathione synthase/RimK-type ligase-like ATP-grasp enzyme